MSKRDEKISAFLDGEMHPDELMSFSLSAEDSDARISARYRLIGDALRDELDDNSFVDVSTAVRDALAGENIADAGVAPSRQRPDTADASGRQASAPSWLGRWFRPVAGMAMAASAALAVVMSFPQLQTGQPAASRTGPVATASDPLPVYAPVVEPVRTAVLPVYPESGFPVHAVPVVNRRGLNPYLNEHFATQGTLQSRMPYVRAVSYQQRKK